MQASFMANGSAFASAYRTAKPYCHVVVEDFVDAGLHAELRQAFEDEPAASLEDEIFHVMASKDPPEHPAFRKLHAGLASPPMLSAIGLMTGERVSGVEMRAYAYLAGHYLLPHADRDSNGRRAIAFAYYVDVLDELVGGELDLYACETENDAIVRTTIARTIAPRPNTCVLFEVTPHSLHRVREVTRGARLSVAGWFLR